VVEQLGSDAPLVLKESPITRFKAIKNEKELAGMRAAHVRDGVAMVRFLIWLEEDLPSGEVTELKVGEKLNELRAKGEHFQGPSFESIVGFGEHGAIVHYASTPETDVTIRAPGILLIDSGGQYLDGTTDITRTLAMGEATAAQREEFTRVLKCHIALAKQPFPKGTDGVQLDTLARMFLWEKGLNFGHGIGHGVGAYLNVHEMPPAISFLRGRGIAPEPGMVVTNEPGYYKEGEYGFRQENVMVVEEAVGLSRRETPFYKLESITLCPIDLKLVETSLLSPDEIAWLNDYHGKVREALAPHLNDAENTWLEKATAKV
jgi:Xaa-Pro aminopeptidase